MDPTAAGDAVREDEQGGIPVRSLSVSQFGVTVVQSLLDGVHTGTTVRYVRGHGRTAVEDALLSPTALLDPAKTLMGPRRSKTGSTSISACWRSGGRSGRMCSSGTSSRSNSTRPDGERDAAAAAGAGWRRVRRGFEGRAADGVVRRRRQSATARVSGDRRAIAVGAEHWMVRSASRCAGGAQIQHGRKRGSGRRRPGRASRWKSGLLSGWAPRSRRRCRRTRVGHRQPGCRFEVTAALGCRVRRRWSERR